MAMLCTTKLTLALVAFLHQIKASVLSFLDHKKSFQSLKHWPLPFPLVFYSEFCGLEKSSAIVKFLFIVFNSLWREK